MVAAIRALSVNVCFDTVRLLIPDSIIAPESPQALLAVHGAFMSEIINCDPNRGFIAFPVAVFDLDLTPGAFRTLAELCRMANTSGQCWPSLAQLGRRLGRSRASVSAYIAELRALGVLSTEEQKMANGYNYRLRYTVTFWKEWRAGLRRDQKPKVAERAMPKPERSIQPTERPLRTKNHIHLNQQGLGEVSKLVSNWKQSVGKMPYPEFNQWPSDPLLRQTEAMLKNMPENSPLISADISDAFTSFANRHGLTGCTITLAEALYADIKSLTTLNRLMETLEADWQSHWQKLPNAYQVTRLLKSLPLESDPATEHKLLKSYLQRWKLYERRLPSPAIRSKVAA